MSTVNSFKTKAEKRICCKDINKRGTAAGDTLKGTKVPYKKCFVLHCSHFCIHLNIGNGT